MRARRCLKSCCPRTRTATRSCRKARKKPKRPLVVQLHDLWSVRLISRATEREAQGLPFYWLRPRLSVFPLDKLDTMVRLLFWIAVIGAAFWLWRKFNASQQSSSEPKLDDPLKMVRCAHCGVHLPTIAHCDGAMTGIAARLIWSKGQGNSAEVDRWLFGTTASCWRRPIRGYTRSHRSCGSCEVKSDAHLAHKAPDR